jgi:hypothetical protein
MGIGLRVFLVNDDDSLMPVPLARYQRLLNHGSEESLAQFAGRRLRYVLAAVTLLNRKPVEIIRLQCSYLTFDFEGKLDLSEFDKAARLATQALSPITYGQQRKQVINAEYRFAKKRFEHQYTWKLTPGIQASIMNEIFGTG